MVPFFKKSYAPQAYERVNQVIDSGFLTTGRVVKDVEGQLEEFFAIKSAALCSSWTACWEIVLSYHNIGPGDEVIMPSMTFVSCANAVARRGAKVIFCDISPGELVVTAETISPHISEKTKIILIVHLYGLMADMKKIEKNFPDIAIYEDAAHCFEGRRDGIQPGNSSNGAMFSFYATKNISCGEGGALISNQKNLVEYAKSQRLHGMSKTAIDRYTSKIYSHWDVESPGYKFNLPDVLAALLPEQISNCLSVRKDRVRLYEAYLDSLDWLIDRRLIRLQHMPEKVEHAHHLFAIAVDKHDRDSLLHYFGEQNVGVAVNFRDLPSLSFYKDHNRPVNAASWGDCTISLPFYPDMPESHIKETVGVLKNYFTSGKVKQ